MPSLTSSAVASIAVCALASATAEAADLNAAVVVVPKAGGTVKHPQGHKITVKAQVVPDGAYHPTVTGFELWFGPGLESHRDRTPTCSFKALREGGPDGCPAKSIVGAASGSADPADEAAPAAKFMLVNTPGGRLSIYATLQRPARVRAVLPGTVFDNVLGSWPHRDTWEFPPVLQKVAGIPIALEQLTFSFGYTRAAKNYISSTSCPKGGWAWKVRVHTRATTLATQGRAPCDR